MYIVAYIWKVVSKSLLEKSLKVIEKSLFKVIGSRYLKSRYQQIVGESAFLLSIRHLRVCQQIVGGSEIYRQIVRLDIYFIFSLQSR